MKLILVYNADEGLFNAVTDTIHKALSPSTYECSLCRFTYGMVGMRKSWGSYLSGLKAEKEFLHRREFHKKYPDVEAALPAIFTETADGAQVIVSAEEINACENLEELISIVDERVDALAR
ncbi:MAG: hypothetical protein CBD18_04900 [Opitutales bacterium TMED158]|nr:MAG: hypothetical protein CBD18_04900 [Opitutales bacterium TMED158]